ncbi:MAG: hypothetical protein KFH87_12750 [Bacteroidetes bacterium]|nr:hypothetical protein [Bacteroidota bacterium]
MALTIETDNDNWSEDNARQMQPMMGCRRFSWAVGASRKSAERQFVDFEFPTDWPGDTTVMSQEDGSTMVAIPECVLFIVDVIFHNDETVLEPLDSILHRRVNHFYELDEHSIEGSPVDPTIFEYFERHRVPDQYTGDMLRIRLRPVCVPQLRGDDSRRVLFVRFYRSPGRSVHYRENFREYGVEKAPVKHLPENRGGAQHVTISPNVLERSRNVSSAIEGEWIADEMVEITMYSIDGKVAWKGKHAPPVSTAATIHIAPHLHDVRTGVYIYHGVKKE